MHKIKINAAVVTIGLCVNVNKRSRRVKVPDFFLPLCVLDMTSCIYPPVRGRDMNRAAPVPRGGRLPGGASISKTIPGFYLQLLVKPEVQEEKCRF